jgi:hypothetical protein
MSDITPFLSIMCIKSRSQNPLFSIKTYVFTHKHDGTDLSESLSEHADLLGGNVVGINEEAVLVLSASCLESLAVVLLLNSSRSFFDDSHFTIIYFE